MVGRTALAIARGRHSSKAFSPLREGLLSKNREPVPVEASKQELYGSKTIGLLGGIMLIINNLAGPTVCLMPSLTQEAGWMGLLLAQALVGALTAICGFMTLAAMRAIPGNRNFDLRVEFIDVVRFYMPGAWSVAATLCYLGYLVVTLMTYVIQTAQVLDYAFRDCFGCAYGLQLWPAFEITCGALRNSSTPFSDDCYVLSFSFIVVAVVCAPLSSKNLDDNITLQFVANIGFSVLVCIWLCYLVEQPMFPRPIPIATSSPWNLVNTLFFNFALATSLPSWANEKQPDVPVGLTFAVSMVFVIVVYSAIGIVGGMAFEPYFTTDEDLFSKLSDSGSRLLQATVSAYPVLQNLTSIPVFSILIRYNLLKVGSVNRKTASALSIGLPWVLSIPFYTGQGFQMISSVGGIAFSLVINNIVPVVVYLKSRGQHDVTLQVQRCISAKVFAEVVGDAIATAAVGPGLVVAVSFTEGATPEGIRSAARFVLTAKLSGSHTWAPSIPGGANSPPSLGFENFDLGAESVLDLCKRGHSQGVLVVPQAALMVDMDRDWTTLSAKQLFAEDEGCKMYDLFVCALRSIASEHVADADIGVTEHDSPVFFSDTYVATSTNTLLVVAAGDFNGSRLLEMKAIAPFMHSFTF